ncbi:Saxiphilin like protein [Argiope bruennichi]|uniref:Saxiphilin like protein n=2 Tax=Argiope bruennichi TaxID=94029 RepID=A0A8T0EGT0_ARGBR|nr:Saxiphilin like protein [Argiope bruennichi]
MVLLVSFAFGNAETKCQENRQKAQQSQNIGGYVPQCDANGNYTKLQCVGSAGQCFCVDPSTGKFIKRATTSEECD